MSRAKLLLRHLPAAALFVVSACATQPSTNATSETVTAQAEPSADFAETKAIADRADPLARARMWSIAYNADPIQLDTAIEFAKALRAIGSNERAVEVASRTAIIHPDSYELMMVYGRALSSKQDYIRAAQTLGQAITIDASRADAYAALGLVYDKGDRHDLAQQAYAHAIEIDPARPGTLSNYGLSLALSGDINKAEDMLKQAILLPGADQRVEQNLALILGLQGKFEDMQDVSQSAPAGIFSNNADILREILGAEDDISQEMDPDEMRPPVSPPAAAAVIVAEQEAITSVPPSPEPIPETSVPQTDTAEEKHTLPRGSMSN